MKLFLKRLGGLFGYNSDYIVQIQLFFHAALEFQLDLETLLNFRASMRPNFQLKISDVCFDCNCKFLLKKVLIELDILQNLYYIYITNFAK